MYNGKKIIALITARGGSKGIPKKNIMKLGGKPLIAWTIEEAKKSQYLDRLILSTEDHNVITIARKYGCEVPFVRPDSLARDTTPSMDVINHALHKIKDQYDYLLLLQPTSPFRKTQHIDGIIRECLNMDGHMMISVAKVKKHPSLMFYMKDGYLSSVMNVKKQLRRQDMPEVYTHNGALYLARIDYLQEQQTYLCDKAIGYVMHSYENIDIDEPEDWQYAEYLIETGMV